MIASDETHWWYRGRRRVLRAELDRLPELSGQRRLLDAGCGSGRTLDELADYGATTGIDLSGLAIAATAKRGHEVVLAPIEDMPFEAGSFDAVTCLDVLEHTPDDRASLRELRRITRPGGTLLITVPAFPSLWSQHDVLNQHYRRYTRPALRAAAIDAGWKVERDTFFNSLLLAPAAVTRLLQRFRPAGGSSDLSRTPAILNDLLEHVLGVEARAIRAGLRLPFGLSLMAVMTNPEPQPRRRRSDLVASAPAEPALPQLKVA